MLLLTVRDLPLTLEQIANNYARVDTGANVVSPNNDWSIKAIQEIPIIQEKLAYNSDAAISTNNSISDKFNLAKSEMETIQEIVTQLNWESNIASGNFRQNFASLKEKILEGINNILVSFKDAMNATEADMNAAENANAQ